MLSKVQIDRNLPLQYFISTEAERITSVLLDSYGPPAETHAYYCLVEK